MLARAKSKLSEDCVRSHEAQTARLRRSVLELNSFFQKDLPVSDDVCGKALSLTINEKLCQLRSSLEFAQSYLCDPEFNGDWLTRNLPPSRKRNDQRLTFSLILGRSLKRDLKNEVALRHTIAAVANAVFPTAVPLSIDALRLAFEKDRSWFAMVN